MVGKYEVLKNNKHLFFCNSKKMCEYIGLFLSPRPQGGAKKIKYTLIKGK
jgi:ribosomal protein L24E